MGKEREWRGRPIRDIAGVRGGSSGRPLAHKEGTVMGLVIDIVLFVAGMAGGMLVVSLCVAARMGDMQARRLHSERDRTGRDPE